MESARICFCRWLVPHRLLVVFCVLTSPPLRHPPPFLWCAEMRPQLSLLKDAKALDSDSLWRPHVNAFASWKTSPNAVMPQILRLRTLPGIWGNTTVHRRHTRHSLHLGHSSQPELSSLLSFLTTCLCVLGPGSSFHDSNFPFDHYVLQQVLRSGWGVTAEPQKWMFDSLLLSFN